MIPVKNPVHSRHLPRVQISLENRISNLNYSTFHGSTQMRLSAASCDGSANEDVTGSAGVSTLLIGGESIEYDIKSCIQSYSIHV